MREIREKNVIMKKENKIFSKQFVTTEPTKERKLFNGCLSLMLKKYKKIFCKQFVRIKKITYY